MNGFQVMTQCGMIILIPLITLVFGLYLGFRYVKKYHLLASAILIGVVFFEFAIIGFLIDPKVAHWGFKDILVNSALIGFGGFLFVYIIIPIARFIYGIFWNKF